MHKEIIIFISVLLLLASCRETPTNSKLTVADSLFQSELTDSAIYILGSVSPTYLSEKDKAYYDLLKGIERYKKDDLPNADLFISNSIMFYEKEHDHNRLAMSYIYKGSILSNKGDDKKAIYYFKKAEELIKDIDNPNTKIKIFVWLAWENENHRNYDLAIIYGQKALHEAREVNNKRWIGYSLELISSVYNDLGKTDSTSHYQEMAIPYIKYQPIDEQITYMGNQASYFWKKGEQEKAIGILKQSLEIKPIERTYGQLAELYTEQGLYTEAEKFWKNAFKTQDLRHKALLMYPYADWLKIMKKEDEAWKIMKQLIPLKDSLSRMQQTEAIKDVQDSYDRMIENIRHRNEKTIILSCTVFFIILLLVIWMYYHLKSHEAKKQLAENQIMMTSYTSRIKQLEDEGKDQSKEVKELRRRLEALRNKQAELLYKGKEKYERITIHKETALTWHKEDYNNVVEYYRTINMPFVIGLERNYKHLSAGNKFLLLLSEELKYNDEEIYRIMGMNNKALRTQRYRIRKEKIKE